LAIVGDRLRPSATVRDRSRPFATDRQTDSFIFLKVQLLTLVHSPRKRSSLPLRVERPLQRLHAARQLFQPRMVDDQDAVEMVELVLEGPRRLPAEGYCEGHAGDVLRLHLDHLST